LRTPGNWSRRGGSLPHTTAHYTATHVTTSHLPMHTTSLLSQLGPCCCQYLYMLSSTPFALLPSWGGRRSRPALHSSASLDKSCNRRWAKPAAMGGVCARSCPSHTGSTAVVGPSFASLLTKQAGQPVGSCKHHGGAERLSFGCGCLKINDVRREWLIPPRGAGGAAQVAREVCQRSCRQGSCMASTCATMAAARSSLCPCASDSSAKAAIDAASAPSWMTGTPQVSSYYPAQGKEERGARKGTSPSARLAAGLSATYACACRFIALVCVLAEKCGS
jgi:hypothetical protein